MCERVPIKKEYLFSTLALSGCRELRVLEELWRIFVGVRAPRVRDQSLVFKSEQRASR